MSGCATAWDIQFSGEGLSGARAYRPWGNDSSQVQNLFAPFLYWERVACKKPRPDIEGGPDAEEEEEDEEKKEEGEASGSTEVRFQNWNKNVLSMRFITEFWRFYSFIL